jgi:hypothetical protein
MVIAGTGDPQIPQMEANLNWNTSPTFAADTFVFKPPANAKAITIRTAEEKRS